MMELEMPELQQLRERLRLTEVQVIAQRISEMVWVFLLLLIFYFCREVIGVEGRYGRTGK